MVIPFMVSSLIAFSTPKPVRIDSCSVSAPVTTLQGDAGSMTLGGYDVRIRFTDATQQPVSRVTFRLDDGTSVVDAGTFSPNAKIDHTLRVPATQADSCRVVGVTFTDGASWNDDR